MQGLDIVIFILALVLCITVHEFAHAWAATALGDDTARRQGRLSLNPLVHLDPMGSVMILLASLTGFGIGWGRPVPVNPMNMSVTPAVGMGLTAAAGPASNLIMALLSGLLLRMNLVDGPALTFLAIFFFVNLGLMLFNLIPIFPLDGYRIVVGILGAMGARQGLMLWMRQEQWGPLLLLGIVLLNGYIPIFSLIMGPPRDFLARLILGS